VHRAFVLAKRERFEAAVDLALGGDRRKHRLDRKRRTLAFASLGYEAPLDCSVGGNAEQRRAVFVGNPEAAILGYGKAFAVDARRIGIKAPAIGGKRGLQNAIGASGARQPADRATLLVAQRQNAKLRDAVAAELEFDDCRTDLQARHDLGRIGALDVPQMLEAVTLGSDLHL
jgi:hypothetical protein